MKKNFTYNLVYQILIVLVPVLTTPYVSRVLGAESLGVYGFTASVAGYFLVFANLGFANYGNRSIAKVRNDKYQLRETFWSIYMLQILVGLVIVCIYLVVTLGIMRQNNIIFLVQGIIILSALFDTTWLFMGLEKFGIVIFRNTLIKILTLAAIFMFVKGPDDLLKYALIVPAGQLIGFIIVLPMAVKEVGKLKFNLKKSFQHFKPVLVLFVPMIAISLFTSMDTILVGIFSSAKQVAFYQLTSTILSMPKSVIGALGAVMLPRLAHTFANGNDNSSTNISVYMDNSIIFISFYSFAAMFGLIGVAPILANVFLGNGYGEVGYLLTIIATVIPIYAWGNLIRTQLLIPKSNDKPYVISIVLGAITNVTLNLILIRFLGALGGVIATVLTEYVLATYVMVYCAKDIHYSRYGMMSGVFISIGIIMAIVTRLIGIKMGYGVVTLMVQVIVGMFIYLSFTLVYLKKSKNKLFSELSLKVLGYKII
ncbi:oligosaccharide flippase family protein [Periweissella cryptocerci]|uniref:oligosaccharide flippase family protein n=1 Tax=Periweissella cryptocerci TaxID=2506420 RepID=UPI0014049E2F|nr:oligosaccharide flippase family protein [Periweissella cryptocerci]